MHEVVLCYGSYSFHKLMVKSVCGALHGTMDFVLCNQCIVTHWRVLEYATCWWTRYGGNDES